jgi:hypothetical protein
VNPLFDNADGTTPPGQAGSLWTSGSTTDPWVQNPAYHNSLPNSYFANPQDSGFALTIDTSLALINPITISNSVGSARVTFFSRYFNDPDDSGNIEVSTDNGTKWTSLKVLKDAPLVPPADTRMQNYEVDLTPYKGIPIKLRFRYNTADSIYPAIHSLGWWVDDINVDGATWTQIGTTGGNTTSLNITSKPNGHYYYRVRAVYANGSITTNSNVQDIVVNAPVPTSIVSRKTHGAAGNFNIPLPGIECRSGGPNGNYDVVFGFATPVTPSSATCGGNAATTNTSGNETTVHCTGITSPRSVAVTLDGNAVNMNVLVGDTNADRAVNSADISQTKSQSGQPVTSSNFREDLNVDGSINSADISLVKSKSGTGL